MHLRLFSEFITAATVQCFEMRLRDNGNWRALIFAMKSYFGAEDGARACILMPAVAREPQEQRQGPAENPPSAFPGLQGSV